MGRTSHRGSKQQFDVVAVLGQLLRQLFRLLQHPRPGRRYQPPCLAVLPPQSRLAKTTDIPQLAQLFYETVMRNAPQHYTEAQTQARASFALEERRFAQFLTEATTFLMEDGSGILGFAGLAADGHLNYPSFNGHTGCIIFLQ